MLTLGGLAALSLVTPIGAGHRDDAGHRRLLLPADNPCLPERRRRVHRRQGEPRTPAVLIAAAALLIDYVLTVAVSIAAGVAAITSAFPAWHLNRVELCARVRRAS